VDVPDIVNMAACRVVEAQTKARGDRVEKRTASEKVIASI
jgi:hypothetical protein